ncbi:MAG: prolipoprotein diacylglyceryl transferase, partial [Bacteroidales bacterium]|nr:prolipoprotein diacylglyceryl transferase [Bacteroidales bacterium]
MSVLLQIIWDTSPVLIDFGNFAIRYYSLFFAAGFILSYFIIKNIYKKEIGNATELDKLVIYVVVGSLLGARLVHCVFYDWEYYLSGFLPFLEIFLPVSFKPEFSFIGYQGLASHGGALGIIISILIFKNKSEKKSLLWLLDRIAIPTGFAGAFIRLGNLMNSEIYGHCTDLPWGFVFVRNGDICASHPTQIYE